jgi:hypothetical protein
MPKCNPNGKARVFIKAASCDFTANERLEVRQDAFTRGGEYLVKAGSEVRFLYVEPDTNGAWSRCLAQAKGREHFVTLPTAQLWRPAR